MTEGRRSIRELGPGESGLAFEAMRALRTAEEDREAFARRVDELQRPEGYRLEGASAMSRISRDPADLMAATIGENHRYPDGVVLYLGTMFAPVEDREAPGKGFTHKVGDVVTIASPKLGRLQNRIVHCADAEPWTFGAGALMRNLAQRRLI